MPKRTHQHQADNNNFSKKKRHTRNIPTVSFCFCDCFYTLKHLSIKPTYKGLTYLSFIKKKHTYTTTKHPTSAKLACLQNLNPPLLALLFTPVRTTLIDFTAWNLELMDMANIFTTKSITSQHTINHVSGLYNQQLKYNYTMKTSTPLPLSRPIDGATIASNHLTSIIT